MNTIFLVVFLTAVSCHHHSRHYAPSFLRDSVEKVTNYPFKTKPVTVARKDDADLEAFRHPPGQKKSYLKDYVFGGFGDRNLPLREAVESLPMPLLTAER